MEYDTFPLPLKSANNLINYDVIKNNFSFSYLCLIDFLKKKAKNSQSEKVNYFLTCPVIILSLSCSRWQLIRKIEHERTSNEHQPHSSQAYQ